VLFVGNEASGEDPWKGQVQLLQIWNRALPEKTVKRVVAREKSEDMNTGMLVSYDFSGSSPFRDQRNFLPELKLVTDQTGTTITGATQFDGSSWLSSRLPAENLTLEIKKSNRFTVHVVCTPAETQYARGHIVSLSEIDDNVNFSLRQDQGDLVLWFRNPLSETRSILAWYVRGALEPEKPRDIIASYDGSEAIIYLDGNRVPATFRLSSAAGFAHTFSFIETSGLNGYILVYEIFVFLPAGMLLGLAGRNWNGNQLLGQCLIFLGVGVPAVLLEILAARVGGHGIVAGNIAYALIFGMAGVMLINSDRGGEISRPMP
jgi:hypothetical protein